MGQFFFTPLCIRCGSFAAADSLFCKICWRTRIAPRLNECTPSHVQDHVHLFDWREGDPAYWEQFVYRMKSDRSLRAWNFYAGLLAEKLNGRTECLVAAVPGSHPASVHADILAALVAENMKWPLVENLLLRRSSHEQKQRSLYARSTERQFELNRRVLEEITIAHSLRERGHKEILLVDDLLTSGSSYRQCAELIKPLLSVSAATLFYRPRRDR